MNANRLRDIIARNSYAEESASIRKAYFEMFGERLKSRCKDCVKDAVLLMYNALKDKGEERKYLLRHDTAVYDKQSKQAYNCVTITDAIAERILKERPELAKRFVSIPQ